MHVQGYSKLMPLLRTYVQSVCVREKISQMYLAPTDDLEAFAKAFTADLENDMEGAPLYVSVFVIMFLLVYVGVYV